MPGKAYMRRQTVTINWSDELPLAQGIEFPVQVGLQRLEGPEEAIRIRERGGGVGQR